MPNRMTASHPIEPIPEGIANGRVGKSGHTWFTGYWPFRVEKQAIGAAYRTRSLLTKCCQQTKPIISARDGK